MSWTETKDMRPAVESESWMVESGVGSDQGTLMPTPGFWPLPQPPALVSLAIKQSSMALCAYLTGLQGGQRKSWGEAHSTVQRAQQATTPAKSILSFSARLSLWEINSTFFTFALIELPVSEDELGK